MIREKRKNFTVCTSSPLTVCCPDFDQDAPEFHSSRINIENKSLVRKLHENKCTEYTRAVYTLQQPSQMAFSWMSRNVSKCGSTNIPLVIGGENAKPREFPHMALIGYTEGENVVWKCGGTIISEEYILTAAHCLETIFGPAEHVRLGELDLSSTDEESDVEDFKIASRIPHPLYTNSSKYHDIALLKLDRKIKLNPYKRPACLPSSFQSSFNTAIVTGWGKTRRSNSAATVLQKVVLDIFNAVACSDIYTLADGNRRALSKGIDDETQLCAGSHNESKDACQGDSGGPLQVYHHSEYCMYTVVGVTSFGIACGTRGVPGVFTRIYPYNEWIESIVY